MHLVSLLREWIVGHGHSHSGLLVAWAVVPLSMSVISLLHLPHAQLFESTNFQLLHCLWQFPGPHKNNFLRTVFDFFLTPGGLSNSFLGELAGLWFSLLYLIKISYQLTLICWPPKSPLFFRAPLSLTSPHSVSNKVSSFREIFGVLCSYGLPLSLGKTEVYFT